MRCEERQRRDGPVVEVRGAPATSRETQALQRADRCFWLDGGGSTTWSGQRSLIGVLADDDVSLTYDATRREVTRHQNQQSEVVGDDIFTVLDESLDGSPDTHWVGYFGYAARPDLPARPAVDVPDAVWMQCRDVTWQDETERDLPTSLAVPPQPTEVAVDPSYADAFARVQEHLHAGNSYEVNLTYRRDLEAGDPLATYRRLRAANPAPYAGYLAHHGTHLLSASPERYASIDRHGLVEARPIKGTTPRGATPEADAELARHLATDPKFRAENLMIVDLLRNDLSMVCELGSVEVPELMQVESYTSVHQLVSTIRGHLRTDVRPVQALRQMFPAGSMTGAPKLRTMQIIDEVESSPRGIYSGAFGWISGDGRADLGVVIRSLIRSTAGDWHLGTGGGITVRSDLAEEWAETRWKAERLIVPAE